LELLTWITNRVDQLDAQLADVVARDARARLLLTHPGVGPLTALTTVLVLGPLTRFPDGKHVVSYVGLAPSINASADKHHLGKITKQGNALLRWVLGQAAPLAARADDDLRRRYFAVLHRRGRPKAPARAHRPRRRGGEDPRDGRPEDEDGSTRRSAPARPAQA
jgi:transposase